MKITFAEHDGCFAFDLIAETMADAAALTRFGMNHTNEIRTAGADVKKDGNFLAFMVIGKHKRANSDVPKRK